MTLPVGTVTFLFTDIEGSTRLWEQHPETMRPTLARHDAIVREAIEHDNGVVFKTVGDSFCAAFATVTDALNAALAVQRALVSEPWPPETPLRVRMVLHTGAVEQRDNDYFGPPLNRAARLLAAGHGGQTLVSASSYELIRDHLPTDASLQSLGEHRLRDLERPETVFQLLHPDLPSEFPPLRSLESTDLPNNLPVQLTSFIGREKEMTEIKAMLRQTRLLTLTGSGGCGKTRLSLQVAADALEDYPDGAWLVELAALSDPTLVPQTVASVLGVEEIPGQPLLQTLTNTLKPRRLLMVLDNCEHLLAACAQLADVLLRTCPHVRILTSSREGLNIAGELTYRVPSLSLPERDQALTPETVSRYEAIRLFVERAVFHHPTFIVNSTNAAALAAVCHRLDGIPLAIELAAARVRSMSVEEIHARLDQRFRLLTGGSRTALPRQQTLRALLDWSYNLLNAPEKTLLGRLSVFAGGWTLEAAEQVCSAAGKREEGRGKRTLEYPMQGKREEGREHLRIQVSGEGDGVSCTENQTLGAEEREGMDLKAQNAFPLPSSLFPLPSEEILDLLTSLADKSLVVAETSDSETRYRLLETVRQYAQERLAETEEGGSVRDRHRDYFLALAEEAWPNLRGVEQARWLERLEAESDNLRAALAWCDAADDGGQAGLRLAGALRWFWYVRGHLSEGRAYLAEALARTGAAERTLWRSTALHGAGVLASTQGDCAAARALFEESLTITQELGDRWGSASTLNSLGILASTQGDYTAARALFEESLAIKQELGDRRGIATSLNSLGIVAATQGDYGSATKIHAECLAIRRELADKRGIAISLDSLGVVASTQGDYAAARALFEESLAIKQELGDRRGIASTLNGLGTIAGHEGDYRTARRLHQESLAIRRELADRRGIASSLHSLGKVSYDEGDYDSVRALYEESLTIRWELGDRRSIAESLAAFARLACQGHPERAARLWGAAEALREAIRSPLPLNAREEYDRDVAAVRKHLREETFAMAWAAGRAMTPDQAVAYALEDASS